MAFDQAKLAAAWTVGKQTCWRYDTADAHATVDSANYFDTVANLNTMRIGDIIDVIVWSSTAFTAVSTYGRHIVNANDGTHIDVSDVTVGTVTDTD